MFIRDEQYLMEALISPETSDLLFSQQSDGELAHRGQPPLIYPAS